MIKVDKCPYCGSNEIEQGMQRYQGKMYPTDKLFKIGSNVIADICTECGYIIAMRVENPNRFK